MNNTRYIAPCTYSKMGFCNKPGKGMLQTFCSEEHLNAYSSRETDPKVVDFNGHKYVYFYNRKQDEENYEFSNSFPAIAHFWGIEGRSAEQVFQALKFHYTAENEHEQKIINQIRDQILKPGNLPKQCVAIAKRNKQYIRKDWYNPDENGITFNEKVIYGILLDKFTRNKNLEKKLINTKDANIVFNNKKDLFWGCGARGQGKNRLGVILTEVRKEIKTRMPDPSQDQQFFQQNNYYYTQYVQNINYLYQFYQQQNTNPQPEQNQQNQQPDYQHNIHNITNKINEHINN